MARRYLAYLTAGLAGLLGAGCLAPLTCEEMLTCPSETHPGEGTDGGDAEAGMNAIPEALNSTGITSSSTDSDSETPATFASVGGSSSTSPAADEPEAGADSSDIEAGADSSDTEAGAGNNEDANVGICGDGVFSDGEVCDDGNAIDETACAYGQATCTGCNATCSKRLNLMGPTCGDGTVSDLEACDTAAAWCQACKVVPSIAAGGTHTCALLSTGGVKCWGEGATGALGNGGIEDQRTPVGVSGLSSDVSAIALGALHTCALLSSGRIKCWGGGATGALGNGGTDNQPTPVSVSGLDNNITALAAGDFHTCALLSTGGVTCWGGGATGALGNGTTDSQLTPVEVVGLSGVTAITAGESHTCALLEGGAVKCWGSGYFGQLGDGNTQNQLSPESVSGLGNGVAALAASGNHTCALLTAGGVECWGKGYGGQLGNGATADQHTPATVSGLTAGVVGITAGAAHTCALLASGAVKCWGYGYLGQLGNGDTLDQLTPVSVPGLSAGAVVVTAGSYHTCALLADGTGKCWGGGEEGQLGNGATQDQSSPVSILDFP